MSVSVALHEWMGKMERRMRAVEASLEEELISSMTKEREIGLLKEKNRCRDSIIEGMGNQIIELKMFVYSIMTRLDELEAWMIEREKNGEGEVRRVGGRERERR